MQFPDLSAPLDAYLQQSRDWHKEREKKEHKEIEKMDTDSEPKRNITNEIENGSC